jgi:hypothetical protein
MKLDQRLMFAVLLGAVLGTAGCVEKGPAERAGEKIDEGIDKAGDKLEDAGDKIKDKTS